MMNPTLYQINSRVFRHRFGTGTHLVDIPMNYWEQLAACGIDYVWLMGVWQTGPNARAYGLAPELHAGYTAALPDWQPEDVIGSPYAIDRYVLHEDLGAPSDLRILKERLNTLGLKLILDFVPNHFHAETSLLATRPELFLEADKEWLQRDSTTFYQPPNTQGRVFAHGKDPYFAAWQDTLQVNYAQPAARQFMQEQLLDLTEVCDGVRCDMAMLVIPEVFPQTWGYLGPEITQNAHPFWYETIQRTKAQAPDFLFLAEVYWEKEWELQQRGFDYTYDKRLLDRLLHDPLPAIHAHLQADLPFQLRSARFLENHDEDRSLAELSESKAQAAAMIAYTVPGMRFFYQGQWEGQNVRIPVQLGREPATPPLPYQASLELSAESLQQLPAFQSRSRSMTAFYDYLLELLQRPILRDGQWELLPVTTNRGTEHPTVIAWRWRYAGKHLTVLVNYSDQPSRGLLSTPKQQVISLAPYAFTIIEE